MVLDGVSLDDRVARDLTAVLERPLGQKLEQALFFRAEIVALTYGERLAFWRSPRIADRERHGVALAECWVGSRTSRHHTRGGPCRAGCDPPAGGSRLRAWWSCPAGRFRWSSRTSRGRHNSRISLVSATESRSVVESVAAWPGATRPSISQSSEWLSLFASPACADLKSSGVSRRSTTTP